MGLDRVGRANSPGLQVRLGRSVHPSSDTTNGSQQAYNHPRI